MTMTIESEKKDEKLTLWLCGRLETSTAPQLQRVVETDLEGVVQLLIDMKQLEYISSAGLRVLLAAYKKLKAKGGSLRICHVNDVVMEVLEVTGFKDKINIE